MQELRDPNNSTSIDSQGKIYNGVSPMLPQPLYTLVREQLLIIKHIQALYNIYKPYARPLQIRPQPVNSMHKRGRTVAYWM
jgi:hypothetical protein